MLIDAVAKGVVNSAIDSDAIESGLLSRLLTAADITDVVRESDISDVVRDSDFGVLFEQNDSDDLIFTTVTFGEGRKIIFRSEFEDSEPAGIDTGVGAGVPEDLTDSEAEIDSDTVYSVFFNDSDNTADIPSGSIITSTITLQFDSDGREETATEILTTGRGYSFSAWQIGNSSTSPPNSVIPIGVIGMIKAAFEQSTPVGRTVENFGRNIDITPSFDIAPYEDIVEGTFADIIFTRGDGEDANVVYFTYTVQLNDGDSDVITWYDVDGSATPVQSRVGGPLYRDSLVAGSGITITYDSDDDDYTIVNSNDISDVVRNSNITDVVRNDDITTVVRDSDIMDVVRDSDITDVVRDSDIMDIVRDSDIMDIVRDSDIINVVRESNLIALIESESDALTIDINGQVTYSGSYFDLVPESEYFRTEIYEIRDNPGVLIGSSYSADEIVIGEVIINNISTSPPIITQPIPLATEDFGSGFSIARDSDNTQMVQNLLDALVENIGVNRNFSNITTTHDDIDLSTTILPPYFFAAEGDNLKIGFHELFATTGGTESDNIVLEFNDTDGNDLFRFENFDVNVGVNNVLFVDTNGIGGGDNQQVFIRTDIDGVFWDSELITAGTPTETPVSRILFSNTDIADDSETYIDAIAKSAETVIDNSIDSDAINDGLLVRLLDHISHSEVIAVVEDYESDLLIDIKGQVTYDGEYVDGILTGTESDYTTTTYSIVADPVELIGEDFDSTSINRVLMTRFGSGTHGYISERADPFTLIRYPGDNNRMAQDLIDGLVASWPVDRDFTTNNVSEDNGVDISSSSLPPFYFDKDSDGSLKVSINTSLREAANNQGTESTDLTFTFYRGAQARFQLEPFDINGHSGSTATVEIDTSFIGSEAGDIFDRGSNSWVTESVTLDGPETISISRKLFYNESDESDIYVDALVKVAESVIDGAIDSDAIDILLLRRLMEERTDNEIISVIRNDSDLDLSNNVIEGKHINSMSIESDHIESEFLSRLLTPAEAESVADGAIDSDAIESGLLSRLLANEDTQHEESEVIRIADSVDIDFGSVDVMDTDNSFSSFTLTTQDYDLGGVTSPRAGYDFGTI